MNIFFLDTNPKTSAQYHNDKHVVKMIVEYAQLLSTAHRVIDGIMYIDSSSGRKIKRWKLNDDRENILYKATHVNHPSSKWTRESSANYNYLYRMFVNLLNEYTHRYGKVHATSRLLDSLKQIPKNITLQMFISSPPQAMPEEYIQDDWIDGYRNYYIHGKPHLAKWTKRNMPDWYMQKDNCIV